MMTEYKRQIDKMCIDSIALTAEDILNSARKTAPITMHEKPKKRVRFIPLVVAAACFFAVGVTALAVTGGWSALIKNLFGDDTTAQIADEGYISELSQQGSDGAFSVAFLAATGEDNAPKLIFDVTVNDENITSEKINMTAYVVSKEVYENDLDNYMPCTAYGYRDAEQAGLYHVMLDAPYAYFLNPTDIVVDVSSITTFSDDGEAAVHETDICFDFSTEDIKLLPVHTCYPDEVNSEYNGITYELLRFASGEYHTELSFRFAFVGSELANGETEFAKLEKVLNDNWRSFSEQIVLTVDGTDYTVLSESLSAIWYDAQGETNGENYCYVTAYMPAAGMRNATSATLKIGDVTCEVK